MKLSFSPREDLKQKKHPVPDIPPPLQALNNMTVQASSSSNNPGGPALSENDDLPGNAMNFLFFF